MTWILVGSLALLLTPAAAPEHQEVTLTGMVRSLSDVLKDRELPADPEPIADQVVLEQGDGTIAPLLSDEASRALFQDKRLRGRKAEIRAWRYPGLPYLRVVSFRVDDQGTLRTPEYYCDVCTIHVRYPQPCPCCQGEMELRMISQD